MIHEDINKMENMMAQAWRTLRLKKKKKQNTFWETQDKFLELQKLRENAETLAMPLNKSYRAANTS